MTEELLIECANIINEGIMDAVKSTVSKVTEAVTKLPQKVLDSVKSVNGWISRKSGDLDNNTSGISEAAFIFENTFDMSVDGVKKCADEIETTMSEICDILNGHLLDYEQLCKGLVNEVSVFIQREKLTKGGTYSSLNGMNSYYKMVDNRQDVLRYDPQTISSINKGTEDATAEFERRSTNVQATVAQFDKNIKVIADETTSIVNQIKSSRNVDLSSQSKMLSVLASTTKKVFKMSSSVLSKHESKLESVIAKATSSMVKVSKIDVKISFGTTDKAQSDRYKKMLDLVKTNTVTILNQLSEVSKTNMELYNATTRLFK